MLLRGLLNEFFDGYAGGDESRTSLLRIDVIQYSFRGSCEVGQQVAFSLASYRKRVSVMTPLPAIKRDAKEKKKTMSFDKSMCLDSWMS